MTPAFRALLPYVNRYRRAFVIGLICVISTTAFQLLGPWVLKYAIDDLNQASRARKLVLYAALLLGVSLVRGLFLFLMRRIIIGASRDIEYDIRNDFFAHLERQPLGYYQARRTGDLMSRATNDLNAVRMMIGPAVMYSTQHRPRVRRRHPADADDRRPADADRADPAAVRRRSPSGTSAARSTSGSSRSRRSSPRSAPSSRKRSPACASSAPTGRRRTSSSASGAANEEYLRRNRVLIRLQGAFYPEHDAVSRLRVAAGAVAGQPRRHPGPDHARRVRRLQRLPGHARVADDRVRLGHQHPAARPRVVEADAGSPRPPAGDRATPP